MSNAKTAKTSENYQGQDEYHRAYYHDIDAPAPIKADRVDPNLPDLTRIEVVDPEMPGAPTKSGREDEDKPKGTEAKSTSSTKQTRGSASESK